MRKMWATLQNKVDLEDPSSLLDPVHLGRTQRAAQVNNRIVMEKLMLFLKLISTNNDVNTEEKNPQAITAWKVMLESVLDAIANWRTGRLTNFCKVSTL